MQLNPHSNIRSVTRAGLGHRMDSCLQTFGHKLLYVMMGLKTKQKKKTDYIKLLNNFTQVTARTELPCNLREPFRRDVNGCVPDGEGF